jgi:hypothetical protein
MKMVLSEHNEPLAEKIPSEGPANPIIEETQSQPPKVTDPGRRLRSIELAVLRGKFKKIHIHPKISSFFRNLKIKKEKYLPNLHLKSSILIIVNIILLVVIILLSREVFALKRMMMGDVLSGIYLNVGKIDQASINTEIQVDDNLKLDFPLQINQPTEIVLTADTPISGAIISLSTGGLNIINAPADIVLPAGSKLPIQLNMMVPVNTTIPISLKIPVNLSVAGTAIHQPLVDLQNVIKPYLFTYMEGSTTVQDQPFCKIFGFICRWWYK